MDRDLGLTKGFCLSQSISPGTTLEILKGNVFFLTNYKKLFFKISSRKNTNLNR